MRPPPARKLRAKPTMATPVLMPPVVGAGADLLWSVARFALFEKGTLSLPLVGPGVLTQSA
jgi:hypothetical protein